MGTLPRSPDWSDREKFWLSQIYPNCSAEDTARIIGRTVFAVRKKAKQLVIKNVYARDVWTREENKILTDGWHDHSMRYLREALPGRTALAIRHQALGPLALGPRLQGMMPINKAAEMVGCCQPLLLRIAETEGVQIVHKYKSCSNNRRLVDEEDIAEAAKRYFRRENSVEFRERTGTPERYYIRVMRWAGMYGKRGSKIIKRLLPEEWDELFNEYKREHGGQEGRAAPEVGSAQERDGGRDRFQDRADPPGESLGGCAPEDGDG